jgi:NDP-sugar pyrophosphorylase family protein
VKKELGDGSNYNLSLQYSNKGEGSGGALLSLRKYLSSGFAVFNTDEIYNVEINDLFRFHQKHQAVATLVSNDQTNLSGIYLFEPEVFAEIPAGFSTIEDSLLPKLAKEQKLVAIPMIDVK